MATTDLKIVVNAQDNASGTFSKMAAGFEEFGKKALIAGGVITGALGLTVKAAADAQVQMASFDATMGTMVGTSLKVATGHVQVKTALALTGNALVATKQNMESASISVREHQANISELTAKYKNHKITQDQYNLAMARENNTLAKLQSQLQGYGADIGKVNTTKIALTKTIHITADSVNKAREAFLAASDAAVKLGFDDEDTAVSLSKLYQRTGDVTQAMKLNSIAMDLARAKGMDLTSASNMVGMVLSGNGKVLKQYGIELNETATPMQQLTELQKKLAGQADAYSKTFTGQMEVFKITVANLEEEIGGQLIPILTEVMQKISPVIDTVIAWTQAHPELTKNIVLATAALGILLTVVGAIGVAMPMITAGFTFLGSTAGIVIGIIAALGLVFYNVYQITNLLLTSLPEIIGGIKAYWLDFLKWITDTFLKPIEKAFLEIWTSIKNTVVGIISDIRGYIQPIIDMVNNLLDGLSRVASTVGSGIKGAITSTVNYVAGARADGGPVSRGSTYLVGERGPELFTAGNSGSIIPNHALAGGGGSVIVNMSNSTFLSEDVARQIGDKIISQFKRMNR